RLLEAAEADIAFEGGRFMVAGTDRGVDVHEVARAAFNPAKLPQGAEPGLYETATYKVEAGNFPNGCHVCEVEIDPDTGAARLAGYVVDDDVGTVFNPLLLEGQIHGALAQGIGQVLMEDKTYDPVTGQVLAGLFMDYAMPRAADLCDVTVVSNPAPTPTNPLGVKGAGEAGTVGAPPAVTCAVLDALAPLGVTHINTPATSERIWQAMREARAT
ncbi:MAG: xanthine dehydrogenase family protein molybdopterin-binding subunit, partial [Alphaproteobacteria bacterium]|nr:xanthine dehydrogenase family protein molybdopterin-binding subunit [Alphaproteobacteria bacterium]